MPIEIDGQKGSIAGTLTWVPLEDDPLPVGAIIGFAALVIVLAIAVFVVRRRARRRPAREEVVEAW